MSSRARYLWLAWGTLVYNLGVIAWGAYVRATGSGAGCGSHWPLCNGEVIPRAPSVETLIEFSHRLTSGLALLLVVAMVWMSRRVFERGHPARRGAWLSLAIMVVEALLGAGLVIFGLVEDNDSIARAVVMGLHLVNTLLLLGALTLAAWWASGGGPVRLAGKEGMGVLLGIGVVAMLVLGVSGAITALGDTLFPARSLREGLAMDFSPTAHILLRLRILHPVIAIATGVYLSLAAGAAALFMPSPFVRRLSAALVGLFALQVGLGFLNLYLLAPVWMQLIHLLVADLVWIALVLLCAGTLSAEKPALAAQAEFSPESP